MKTPISGLLTFIRDTLFPPHEEARIVAALSPELIVPLYQPHKGNGWTALSSFKNTHIRALIHEAKFENNTQAQELLGRLIVEYTHRHPEHKEAYWVPIPLHPARRRERGYNQVTQILSEARVPLLEDVLVRSRNTHSQTTLTRKARLTNMEHAFGALNPDKITGKHLILVDDVVTTGATLFEARDALLPHQPASITLLALAH